MKQIRGWFLLAGIALFVLLLLCSNAAQPGIWNAGGGGFNLLFPEDSSAFRKIQMEREVIAIQLYPGFAVIKGIYQMRNTSGDTIAIRVGYPVQGIYDSEHRMERNEISFDGLYALKVFQDGQERRIIEEPVPDHQPQAQTFDNDNWYVWESEFLPNSDTEISVYFMVNTNNAKITEGYARDSHNAFIYILESGRVWKQPIEEAVFKVQLMEGLTVKDIHGISKSIDFNLASDRQILLGRKISFTPMPVDNVVINYGKQRENFDFTTETAKSATYFSAIDQLSELVVAENRLEAYEEGDPYAVQQIRFLSWLWGLILIPILLLVGSGFWLFRILRGRRK